MQKAPSPDTFRQIKTCRSLAEKPTKSNQLVLLEYYIKSQDLTSALTLLEKEGYPGELGVFMLSYIQASEVAA